MHRPPHSQFFDAINAADCQHLEQHPVRALNARVACSESLQGQRVGPCALLGVLAEGRLGRLYRARRIDTGARAVVQFLNQPDADAYDLRRTPIQHPYLWPVSGEGSYAGLSYLLMPELQAPIWLEVDDLSARPLPEALRIMLQISEAVATLHRIGLLHLHLSAANVRLLGTQPVLMDLGSCRYLHGRSSMVWAGPTHDSPWLAPEQRQPGSRVSKQTDVYALGALLLAAVSAHLPEAFDGLTPAEWRNRLPLLPSAVRAICRRALTPEPSLRHPDAAAFALELHHYRQRLGAPKSRAAWSDRIWQRVQRVFSGV